MEIKKFVLEMGTAVGDLFQRSVFYGHRIRALEARLAALDGGADPEASKRGALDAIEDIEASPAERKRLYTTRGVAGLRELP